MLKEIRKIIENLITMLVFRANDRDLKQQKIDHTYDIFLAFPYLVESAIQHIQLIFVQPYILNGKFANFLQRVSRSHGEFNDYRWQIMQLNFLLI